MTERERLIDLIKQKQDGGSKIGTCQMDEINCSNAELADYLLANGIIVPPVKVGDIVYIVCNVDNKTVIEEAAVEEVSTYRIWTDEVYYDFDDIGTRIFLTRELAEKALAERSSEQ